LFILKMQMVWHGQQFRYMIKFTDQGFCNTTAPLITLT
jgi:hypothetical protein